MIEFLHAGAHRLGLRLSLGGRLLEQVADTDGHEQAVDGTARARLLEELEEALPRARIDVPVAFLGRVPAGRVDEDGLVGEPPVAVAGAAHASNRLAAQAVGKGEA